MLMKAQGCVSSFLPLKRQRHCYVQEPLQQFMTLFPSNFPLTSVRFRYKGFVQPKLHQEISFWHPLPCHVFFRTVGAIAWLFIWMSSYSTSKRLRRKMLFLRPLLVPLPCSFERSKYFMHKIPAVAYLFLRICWMISSQHLPQFDREDLDQDFVCFSAMPLFLYYVLW